MNQELSLIDLVMIIKKRLGIIILGTIVGILIFVLYSFVIAVPKYSSTTQMIVNRTQEVNVIQRADIDTNVQLINTYKDIINSPAILDDVRDDLNLQTTHQGLISQLFITSENDSQVFSIQIIDDDPVMAARIANKIAGVFQDKLSDIMNIDNVTVISQAEANMAPITPNHTLNLALGFIIGGLISTVLAFVLEFMDNTVKDKKVVTDLLGLTYLGDVYEIPQKNFREESVPTPDLQEGLNNALNSRLKI